jgi:hypothetical protein
LAIISNALNRSICYRLGQYLVAEPVPSKAALKIEIALTGIAPTSKALSGISSALGTVVPGPFRVPICMGAIALDARQHQWPDCRLHALVERHQSGVEQRQGLYHR